MNTISRNIEGELIPQGEIPGSVDRISKDKQVIVHCRSGARSGTWCSGWRKIMASLIFTTSRAGSLRGQERLILKCRLINKKMVSERTSIRKPFVNIILSRRFDRLINVCDDISYIFQSGRDPNQSWCNSYGKSFRFSKLRVCC